MKKNNHQYYEILISRYKDNDLNSNEILEMKNHLSVCKSCQKFKNEINSMSSIISGMKTININKKIKNKKNIAYITSAAAALLIFLGVYIIYNQYYSNNIAENSKLIISDLNNYIKNDLKDNIKDEDYAPLSSYFNYNEYDSKKDNDDELGVSIMSAYIYYMSK